MRFVPRTHEVRLRQLLRTFPAVLLYGPRQSGKSTLVRTLFPDWTLLDLERPSDFEALTSDLEGFFDAHSRKVALDEAQRLPALFPALRQVIDRGRTKGRFLLLGSASPPLLKTASESLGGRLGLLELPPFSARELHRIRRAGERWFWGGFPPVHGPRTAEQRVAWLDAYVTTVLERDLPALGLGLPTHRLRILWTMLTHVHGNLLNVSDLARSLTVSSHTVSSYLDVLEWTFMVRRLPPFFANVQKRLTKSPKIYVRDTGLLHFLAGLRRPSELETWPRRGNSFEGMVIEELASLAAERLVRPELFFYRTQAGAEVDLVIQAGAKLLPIEIKLGSSFNHYELSGLRQFMKDFSLKRGWVISTARERRTLARGIEIIPWGDVAAGRVDL